MKLEAWVHEFRELEDDERLETLLELSEELPELSSERNVAPWPAECRVQECQTPVYLWVELRGGLVHVEAEVPRQSPLVRGLVALVVQSAAGASPQEVADWPDDWLPLLNLQDALGMTRRQGLRGVVARIKRDVQRLRGM